MHNSIQSRVGLRIRQLRKQKGYTLESLAEKAGLNAAYLGSLERGRRNVTIENLARVIKALETDFMFFFQDPLFKTETSPRQQNTEVDSLLPLLKTMTPSEIEFVEQLLKIFSQWSQHYLHKNK